MKKILILVALIAISSTNAFASKTIRSPHSRGGEAEIEYKTSYIEDDKKSKDNERVHVLELGYGWTDYFSTALAGELEKHAGADEDHKFTAVGLESKIRFTGEKDSYWLDAGLFAEVEFATQSNEPNELKLLLLLEKDLQDWKHRANIGIEQQFGDDDSKSAVGLYSWSTRYKYMEEFQPGFEYHANFGEIRESEPGKKQKHQIGPVFYGSLPYGFAYDIGYLFGMPGAAPDGEFKAIISYKFNF